MHDMWCWHGTQPSDHSQIRLCVLGSPDLCLFHEPLHPPRAYNFITLISFFGRFLSYSSVFLPRPSILLLTSCFFIFLSHIIYNRDFLYYLLLRSELFFPFRCLFVTTMCLFSNSYSYIFIK